MQTVFIKVVQYQRGLTHVQSLSSSLIRGFRQSIGVIIHLNIDGKDFPFLHFNMGSGYAALLKNLDANLN